VTAWVEGGYYVSANKDSCKIKSPAGTIFVDAQGVWSTKPIRLKPDSIKDDDVTTV
jgi:hypothetical protein